MAADLQESWVNNIFVNPIKAYADYSAKATGRVFGTFAGAVANTGSAVTVLGQQVGQGLSTASKIIAVFTGAYTLFLVIIVVILAYMVLRHGGKFARDFLG